MIILSLKIEKKSKLYAGEQKYYEVPKCRDGLFLITIMLNNYFYIYVSCLFIYVLCCVELF